MHFICFIIPNDKSKRLKFLKWKFNDQIQLFFYIFSGGYYLIYLLVYKTKKLIWIVSSVLFLLFKYCYKFMQTPY
jgi:hypothetical protein